MKYLGLPEANQEPFFFYENIGRLEMFHIPYNLPRVAVKEGGGVSDPVSPRGLGAAVTVPSAP